MSQEILFQGKGIFFRLFSQAEQSSFLFWSVQNRQSSLWKRQEWTNGGKTDFLKAPRPFMWYEEERKWVSDDLGRCYCYCHSISHFLFVRILVLFIRFWCFFGVYSVCWDWEWCYFELVLRYIDISYHYCGKNKFCGDKWIFDIFGCVCLLYFFLFFSSFEWMWMFCDLLSLFECL